MASGDNTVYDNFLGRTRLLDGVTMTAALTTSAYTPLTTDTDLASITGEATGTGYSRQTFTCTILDDVCNIADADHWPTFDTSALDTHHDRVVIALGEDIDDGTGGTITAGTLVSNVFYGDQAPSASWLAELVNGFAQPRRSPIVPVPTIDNAGKYLGIGVDGLYSLLGGTTPAPGSWTALSLPGVWTNAADLFAPDVPLAAVRHSAAADQIDIRAEIIIGPADLVSGLSFGSLILPAVIPSGYRPATSTPLFPAQLSVIVDFTPTVVQIATKALVNPAGDLQVQVGTHLADGTSISELFGARTVSDGVLDSTTTLTSASAAFTADDEGQLISGDGIPDGTRIASVDSDTSVTLSASATASATDVAVTIHAPWSDGIPIFDVFGSYSLTT